MKRVMLMVSTNAHPLDFKPVLNVKWGYYMKCQQARRKADGAVVAMKGYEPSNDVEERKNFAKLINERIIILETLNHAGFPTYLGHFLDKYRINLVFAYDHDTPNLEHLAGERNISEAEACHYALQLAEALDHVHGHGAILRMHPNCSDNPIITCDLKFPRTMSATMCDTISLFLKKDPKEQISSLAELQALPMYSNIWPPRATNKLFWG
ncbi:uncharacterized protein MELLADRAFT_104043 [Melampsora larici-populina 98AG31]|uniref:Protein kinase domain-containing protein n=1 Tax=Melampsora larici-populina (strain 98AG31 / pathotype 3-4-7) TaxID=747676 RepID=F4RDD2_MELLP|nr:uncharacterized protein MELLADRAFT_104043 [Melampsora larici-populina 98AG31]EGG09381.1 hypothetical protein MELLADRAFT_104043 [Melampsora larici-populina 98AG31]